MLTSALLLAGKSLSGQVLALHLLHPPTEASTLVGDLMGTIISPAVLKGLKELGAVQLLLPITVPADPFAKSQSWHSQPLCSAASQHGFQPPFLSAPYAHNKVCAGFLICKPASWPPQVPELGFH